MLGTSWQPPISLYVAALEAVYMEAMRLSVLLRMVEHDSGLASSSRTKPLVLRRWPPLPHSSPCLQLCMLGLLGSCLYLQHLGLPWHLPLTIPSKLRTYRTCDDNNNNNSSTASRVDIHLSTPGHNNLNPPSTVFTPARITQPIGNLASSSLIQNYHSYCPHLLSIETGFWGFLSGQIQFCSWSTGPCWWCRGRLVLIL